MPPLQDLSLDDFASLTAPLVVHAGPEAVPLRVRSARPLPQHALRETPPFAVILEGPLDLPLRQGTFAVDHPERGRMELFLVPVARTASGMEYEAVFN